MTESPRADPTVRSAIPTCIHRQQGVFGQARKRLCHLGIDPDLRSGRRDHQAVRSDEKLLIACRGCLLVPARDQQPGELIETADRDDDAFEHSFVDNRGTCDEAPGFIFDRELGVMLESFHRIDGWRLGLQVDECFPLLVSVEDPLVERCSTQDLLLDMSAETLLDGIEIGIQSVLQRHAQGEIEQVGLDLVALGEVDCTVAALGDEVGDGGRAALAVCDQSGVRRRA